MLTRTSRFVRLAVTEHFCKFVCLFVRSLFSNVENVVPRRRASEVDKGKLTGVANFEKLTFRA